MDNPSSTSSSRSTSGSGSARGGHAWAGILAAALVFALDAILLGPWGPWAALAERTRDAGAAPAGVAADRRAIQALSGAPADRRRVVVMGSSRAAAGFALEIAENALPEVVFAKLGHPGVDPFVLRGLAESVIDAGADAAVLVLSEIETHRPVRLEPIPGPGASGASLAPLIDLLSETGPGFAFRNRDSVMRWVASTALRGYRYRPILRGAAIADLVDFPLDAQRLGAEPLTLMLAHRVALGGPFRNPVSQRQRTRLARVLETLPRRLLIAALPEVDILREVTPGIHVAVQLGLVRRTVARLRATGIAVVLVEAPVHPVAAELYSAKLPAEFREFAAGLARSPGIEFVPLTAMESFEASDFNDLLHTGPRGAKKLTAGMIRGLMRVWEPGA